MGLAAMTADRVVEHVYQWKGLVQVQCIVAEQHLPELCWNSLLIAKRSCFRNTLTYVAPRSPKTCLKESQMTQHTQRVVNF